MGQLALFGKQKAVEPTSAVDSRKNEEHEFVIVTNAPYDVLEYEPSQSYMAMFGIDKQCHEKYASKSLGAPVNLSCKDTGLLFLTKDLLPEANLDVYTSSDEEVKCTLQGIQESIKNQASRVGPEGMLVLYFCGHGVSIGGEEWGLVPCDFDCTPNSVLYPSVILSCLRGCKAKCILLILDCCFSGTMAMKLTAEGDDGDSHSTLLPHTYVMAAGTGTESSITINSLNYTIFTYFFRIALDKCGAKPGSFPLDEIFKYVKECTAALTSLVIRLQNGKLTLGKANPSLAAFEPSTVVDNIALDGDDVDSAGVMVSFPAKTSFVTKFFTPRTSKEKRRPRLSTTAWQWMHSFTILHDKNPLFCLEDKNLFEHDSDPSGLLLRAVFTLMTQSVAEIEFVNNKEMLVDPNLYLVLFIEIMATLDSIHLNIEIKIEHLLYCAPYYLAILMKHNLETQPFRKLYTEIYTDWKNPAEVANSRPGLSPEPRVPVKWVEIDESGSHK